MKIATLRTLAMGLVVAVAAVAVTGCGIPVKLSESVDLVKDIEVPAMPQSIDEIEDIPEEFQQYVDSVEWETEAQALLEELQNEEFSFQREEEFCDLPDLQKIRDEAAAKLPPFLAKRIEVREVIVESIRFVADAGDFRYRVSRGGSILDSPADITGYKRWPVEAFERIGTNGIRVVLPE